MAEVIGVVSGVIGIGTFALQIIEDVQKLKRSLGNLIHSQSRLKALLEELHLLAIVISHVDDIRHAGLATDDNKLNTLLQVREEAAANVLTVLRDIQRGFDQTGTKKTLAMIKFVLNQKEIKSELRELERAKSTWRMADQRLSKLQDQKMHQDTITEISKVQELLNTPVGHARTEVQQWTNLGSDQVHCHKQIGPSTYGFLIDTLLVVFSNNKGNTARVRFSPLAWLSISWGFEAVLYRLFGRPQIWLRSFNIIQRASPARAACARGDLQELSRLFREGLATPYDVTPEGSTLLHVAAACHQAKICEMLLEYGVDISAVNLLRVGSVYIKWTPLMIAVSMRYNDYNSAPFYPQEAICRYETENLRKTEFKASDLSATVKVLTDHSDPNSSEFVLEALHLSPDCSPFFIHNTAQNMEMIDLYNTATHLCSCGQWEMREELFLSGFELYDRAFALIKSTCSDQELPLKLTALMLQVVPKLVVATWFETQVPSTTALARASSFLRKIVSTDVLQSHYSLMKSWDRWGRRIPSWANRKGIFDGSDILWLIIHNPLRTFITPNEYEHNTKIAMKNWLSLLEQSDVDLRDYLEREKQFYSLLPYWLRTNFVRIFPTEIYGSEQCFDFQFADPEDLYDPHTMQFKPQIAKFDLCEIMLDFTLDEPGQKPSVSVRMIPIDVQRWITEVKGLRREHNVPGQWPV